MASSPSSFDYDQPGLHYARHRQPDPHIAFQIHRATGDVHTLLNVGAGPGSYEPGECGVIAVEPSAAQRQQRLMLGRLPAVNASAESLPFDDQAFDASMAISTVHHWTQLEAGLAEMKRVSRNRVVILSYDPQALTQFWNEVYFPELIAIEARRYPPVERIVAALGGKCEVIPVSVPLNCMDHFQEAFYGRPEGFLDAGVRLAQSAWGFLPQGKEAELVSRLDSDLKSGEWDRRFGHYRSEPFFTGAIRLVVAHLRR